MLPSVRIVLKKLGWKEVDDEDDWQLYWTDTSVSLERVMMMKKTQKMNHFCGMLEICRKKKLANNFARMAKVAEIEYTFHPITYTLPDDLDDFLDVVKSKKKKTYILKPDAGCQGKGIRLAQNTKDVHKVLEELGPTTNIVAQKYIAKPFLIDGLKFDLRIYIMIASCDPLRMYIFNEGLARFCTEKYETPKAGNLATAYMHLTNYAVNKRNENFQFNTDEEADDEGSKWSLAALREWMDSHGHDYNKVWRDICDIAVKTVISVQPLLSSNYRSVLGYENDGFSCFEILGMDVMLDSKLKPWLIECNHSPSFGIDTPLDLNIKEALITDTLQLASIDVRAIKKQKKEDKKAAESRLYGRSKGASNLRRAMTPDEVKEFRASVIEKREKWEADALHGSQYSVIYPSPDKEMQKRYEHLLELSAQLFERSAPSRTNATINAVASKKKTEMEEAEAVEKKKVLPSGGRSASTQSRGPGASSGRMRGKQKNDSNATIVGTSAGIDDAPARAGWAAAELSSADSLDSWQNLLASGSGSFAGHQSKGFEWDRRGPRVDASKSTYDTQEVSGEESSDQRGLVYESFSPLVPTSSQSDGTRESRLAKQVNPFDQKQPIGGRPGSWNSRPSAARTEHSPTAVHSLSHGSSEVQRPVSGVFPRRASGRVRKLGSMNDVNRDPSTAGSRPYSGASSRLPSTAGVYSLVQGAEMVDPDAVFEDGSTNKIGMAPLDDILDSYMQTYGVNRLWSGSSGSGQASATVGESRSTQQQREETAGSSQQGNAIQQQRLVSARNGESSRFSGLTIRGIRPR